jgi:integrase
MLSYIEDSDQYAYDIHQAQKIKGLPKEPVRVDEDSFFMNFDRIIKVKNKLLEMGEIQLALLHMMMFDSGARRNEIAQIKKHNLLNGNKTNIVVGKRGKMFPLVYLDDTKELIRLWLDKRGEDEIESLWIVGNGDKKREASYEIIYDWVLRIREVLSEIEGRQINIFPHSYRHSRCECLLQGEDKRILDKDGIPKKFSLEQVQVYLHHSDPKTTLDYSKDHTDEIIDEMFGL